MKNVDNEDSQKEKPSRSRREKVVLTDEQIDAVIRDFQRGMNAYDHTGRKSDNKSKPSTSAQRPSKLKKTNPVDDFDIASINMNILSTDEETSATSTTDVSKATEMKTDTLNDTDVVKERIKAKLAMFDDVEANRDVPVAKSENEAVTETANATITADAATVNDMVEVADSEDEPMKKNSEAKNESHPQTSQPAIPKTSRISAKMRKATRDEFHDSYLIKTDTKGGSPITIAPDVLKFAYRVCSLSGDHKARPTYLINNLLREILKGMEADIREWTKLE